MKKLFIYILSLFVLLCLASCGKGKDDKPNKTTPSVTTPEVTTPDDSTLDLNKEYLVGEYNLAKNVQDGVILHAWNWSYNTIKENLEEIAISGFSTVQTSPIVHTKLSKGVSGWGNWWKLYQPISFEIADGPLGTKEELQSLCEEADKYGIKIICDMVFNHLANSGDTTSTNIEDRLYAGIEDYEKEIYDNPDKYFHPFTNLGTSDSNALTVTQYWMNKELPDLNTGDPYIQQRATDLLKECIDIGVDGFRFDAAKHIETSDDGDYASDFWKNVLGDTTLYAKSQNKEVYYYGEILNDVGGGRKISSYTQYMSITDNGASSNIYNAIMTRNTDKLTLALSDGKAEPNKTLYWAESHDTYADGSTVNYSTAKIHRSWSVFAGRNDYTALYFARPSADSLIGEAGTFTWANQEIMAINRFHNEFIGATDNYYISNNCLVNERYREGDDKAGIIITNVKNAKNDVAIVDLEVSKLKDGTYYDQITGNEFTVSMGKLNGNMGSTGVVILYDKTPFMKELKPVITIIKPSNHIYENGEMTINLSAQNADKLTYQIDSGEEVEVLVSGADIVIDKPCTVTVTAYGDKVSKKSFTIQQAIKKEGYYCIGGVDEAVLSGCKLYAWMWQENLAGEWHDVVVENGFVYVLHNDVDYYGIVLACFEQNYVMTNRKAFGDKALSQTIDIGKPLNHDLAYSCVLSLNK